MNLNAPVLALSNSQIAIAVVCAAVVVYALTMALVVPRVAPNFPGSKNLGLFVVVSMVLVGGMLATVEIFGSEEADEVAAAQIESAAEQATEPPAERPETATEEAPSESGDGAAAPESGGGGSNPPSGDPAAGAAVFVSAGCGGCHTLAGVEGATGQIGPDLTSALVGSDAAFVEQSIVDPDAVITDGFSAGVMPGTFGDQLSDEDLANLVALLLQSPSGG